MLIVDLLSAASSCRLSNYSLVAAIHPRINIDEARDIEELITRSISASKGASVKMYEPSFMSTTTIATYARKITHYGHPEVEIKLDQHNDKPITYTTGDSLSGQVSITAPHTARFDEVEITLEGVTVTHVENMTPVAAHARIDARHPFLKLTMPIPESDYPQPRIAEAGQTYKFPFNFVIPEHLLPTACKHRVVGNHVHEAHLHLPPSMGDKEICPSDDLAPDMVKIQYAIRVRVTRTRENSGKVIVLTDRARKLRVIPAIPEAPPMHIPADDREYTLSVAKTLRKGMFAGKLGRIIISASQTKALAASATPSSSSTIIATLKLRFEPSEANAQPPRLGSLTSKIKASTFYAVKPLDDLANRSAMCLSYDLSRGVYSTTTSLATRCVEAVSWTLHRRSSSSSSSSSSQNPIRRDSGYSTCSSDSSSPETTVTPPPPSAKTWYEASIIVPLTLPTSKTWIPTFHSCIASRIYSLDMSLSVHTPGTGVPPTSISLRLPVQISSGPSELSSELSAAAAQEAESEVEDYLRPRIIQVPGEEYVLTSTLRTGRLESISEPPSSPVYDELEEVEEPPQPQEQGRSQSVSVSLEAPPGYEMLARRWGAVGSGSRRRGSR